jgi:hypothetical protein
MINKKYRDAALEQYGESCEICGHLTSLEVHHIDYQEHQVMENKLRASKKGDPIFLAAEGLGYDEYNFNTKQLSKNDDTKNLSVLCGNCHSLCHLIDYGKNILNAIKPRR